MSTKSAICLATLLLPTLAMAQNQSDWNDWAMGTRFTIQLELFHPSLNTQIRIDSSENIPGTPIDFEQDLGMNDTETLLDLAFGWRVAKKHNLGLRYYELDRSGSAITDVTIKIGDIEFEADLPISSFLDLDVATVSYSYSLLFDEKRELAISAGLTLMDIQFGLKANGGPDLIEAESNLTVPLPTIGLSGGFAFTDKLFTRATAGFFSFDLALSNETGLRGNIATAAVGIYHNTFEHVRFGLAYNYYHVDVDWGSAANFTSLQYTYHGPTCSMAATF